MPHDHDHDHPHDHHHVDEPRGRNGALRVGIGGPVGSGKTALVAALCRALTSELRVGVVTNDIYTTEDADFLRRNAVSPDDLIVAVETGCCPHTAIRDDISANVDAIERLEHDQGPLDLVLLESGGDNLTAIFSRALVDRQVFVLDVAGGDKVPRKGGPGVTTADLLVINKTDLAPLVGADLDVMMRDAARVRADRPTFLCSLRDDPLATDVAGWVRAALTALVKAHARLVVDGEHALVVACEPPLSMRACEDAMYLVGSAAGPIGGDDLSLDVEAVAGTDLVVRSAAASIALPGADGTPSRMRVRTRAVGAGASLTWEPEPLVAAAGCDHVTDVHVELAATATLRWREVLVLGRAGEQPGRGRVRLRVDRGGEPVLRHDLVVGDGHDSFAALGRARVVGTLVIIDDDAPPYVARTQSGPDVELSVFPLERAGALVTVLGTDARAVEAEMGYRGAARYA